MRSFRDGWKDGHMEIHPCVLQDIGPFRLDDRFRRANGGTDGRMDKASYRVACPQLKSGKTSLLDAFWAAAPKGRCPVGHRGEFPYVRTSVRPSVRPSPPGPTLRASSPLGPEIQTVWPKSKQNGPNPAKMGQIQAKWPKTR